MTFIIDFTGTPVDLLIDPETLESRAKIDESSQEILFSHRLKVGIMLITLHLWEVKRSDPNFFSFLSSNQLTPEEEENELLFSKLKSIFSNTSYRQKMVDHLKVIAPVKKHNNAFVIPSFDNIPDQAIADLIQVVVINDLSNILRLLE